MDEAALSLNLELSTLKQASEFDFFTFPLKGKRLIEASAGTGKTFSITRLYLRLLLNLGKKAEDNFGKLLTVREILVVTFTNAATNELRSRIRTAIIELRILFQKAKLQPDFQSESDLIEFIHVANAEHRSFSELIQLLIDAEQSIDEGAIQTIDGLSLKLFKQFSLLLKETGNLELLKNTDELVLTVAEAFWRRYFYPIQNTSLIQLINKIFTSPEQIVYYFKPLLDASLINTIEVPESSIDSLLNQLEKEFLEYSKISEKQITRVKKFWQNRPDELLENIERAKLHKTPYKKENIIKKIAILDNWCKSPDNEVLDNNLSYFYYSNLKNKETKSSDLTQLNRPFFDEFEKLCLALPKYPTFSLDFYKAMLLELYKNVEQKKQEQEVFNHGDPLTKLLNGLNDPATNSLLIQSIRAAFPVAIIDEFQDTNEAQYSFFSQIYTDSGTNTKFNEKPFCLILIGDPKQAIYGFRGGDIFTYLKAKQQADSIYTIKRNWRSGKLLIEAVNSIFNIENPFKYKEIPFLPADFAEKNKEKYFSCSSNNETDSKQENMTQTDFAKGFSLHYFENNSKDEENAAYCAEQIASWLSPPHFSYLVDNVMQTRKKVIASDIVILVPSKKQAKIMQDALKKYNIPSSYFSSKESVFKSTETKWLTILLDAILNRTQFSKIALAYALPLFNLTMMQLENKMQSGDLDPFINELAYLESIYKKQGIFVMIQSLLTQNNIAASLLQEAQGERHLTNLLHLAELLQTASQTHRSLHALLNWLLLQENEAEVDENIQRIDSSDELIKIFTTHSSKGLEFPIVCLPFLSQLSAKLKQKQFLITYHDDDQYQLKLGLKGDESTKNENSPESKYKYEQEAENLRLIYVALTRAIYYCFIITNKSNNIYNNLFNQNESLTKIKAVLPQQLTAPLKKEIKPDLQLEVATLSRKIDTNWKMASYSNLLHQQEQMQQKSTNRTIIEDEPLILEEANNTKNDETEADERNASKIILHDFPKGPSVGTALHSLLEQSAFNQPLQANQIQKILLTLQLEQEEYEPKLNAFYEQFVNTSLNPEGFSLKQIDPKKRLNEFSFLFPIQHQLTAKDLNTLMKKWDPISQKAPDLKFETLNGMLNGFIDLIFEQNGKFYLADYKSNYLGDFIEDYQPLALEKSMLEHRYDLQYQLYTLALHRYLRLRLPDYDYERDFGGVFYLFLRGMNKNSGVYFTRPAFFFIQQLDMMFKNNDLI